ALALLCVMVVMISVATGRANACSFAEPTPHEVDPSSTDTVPPSPPTDVVVDVSRRVGEQRNGCGTTSNSCGDQGRLHFMFEPGTDDAATKLGLRLVIVEGEVPTELEDYVGQAYLVDDGEFWIRVDFDAITEYDFMASWIVVDDAGNESPASEPFEVVWDGCTKGVVGDDCQEPGCGASILPAAHLGVYAVSPFFLLVARRLRRRPSVPR
ncbi:MAG: hypothetical protein V3V08_09300, partial [Nannocystaceae bacterium]